MCSVRSRGSPEGGEGGWLTRAYSLFYQRISGLPDAAGASVVLRPGGPVMWPGTETRTLSSHPGHPSHPGEDFFHLLLGKGR